MYYKNKKSHKSFNMKGLYFLLQDNFLQIFFLQAFILTNETKKKSL